MRYFVYPYKQGSKSAKALALALGGKVLRIQGGTYRPRVGDVVINWGHSAPERDIGASVLLNTPVDIAFMSNKRTAFQVFGREGVPIPRFSVTTDITWDGMTVVRHKLTGHSGEGIELVAAGAELPPAPLYVEYVKKEDEYRVHIGCEEWSPHRDYTGEQMPKGVFRDDPTSIIAVQRKARRLDATTVDWQVRNHANGFVYVRGGVDPPQAVLDAASRAIIASGLCFGAVDVIYNAKQEKAYVLEINTAPGLEGQTIADYAAFFSLRSEP